MPKRRDLVIQLEPIVVRLTPMGFHKFGEDFLRAAGPSSRDGGYSPVPYYCTCRAIELGLKSYLLCRDVPVETLKRREYGHDLLALLKFARSHDIHQLWNPSDLEVEHIRIANGCYEDKGFEYFQVIRAVNGYSDLPDLEVLKGAAAKLLAGIRQLTREVS
jgi:hypothetical protein